MSVNLSKGKILPIGVDLGTATLKMAQLRAMPKGAFTLIAAAIAEVPPEARREPAARMRFLHDGLRIAMKDAAFKGNQCILSLPAEMTFVQHLKLAKMPPEQLASALHWELQGKLPYDPSRAIIRHVLAGEIYENNEVRQEVIVLAVNRDTVEAHINLLRRVKLDCVGMNIEPCAIVDCFARLFRRSADASRATLFIDIGVGSTQVVISHGQHAAFARNLFLAGNQFDQAVADGLKVSLDEAQRMRRLAAADELGDGQLAPLQEALSPAVTALSDQVTSCLRYYESVFPNRPLERAVFLGGQAYDKRLCQMLARQLVLPAQIGDPLAGIPRESNVPGLGSQGDGSRLEASGDESLPDWAVAVGLSLSAAPRTQTAERHEEVVRA